MVEKRSAYQNGKCVSTDQTENTASTNEHTLSKLPASRARPHVAGGRRLDCARCGAGAAHTMSPASAAASAGQAADDDVEEGDDAADDGLEDGADAVDDGHEDGADRSEDGFDLCGLSVGMLGRIGEDARGGRRTQETTAPMLTVVVLLCCCCFFRVLRC